MLANTLKNGIACESDKIFAGMTQENTDQTEEIELRKQFSKQKYDNLFAEISKHHSIEVMSYEISRFVEPLKHGSVILDVGGCWGWYWLPIAKSRPDLKIIILDFVKENLLCASDLLENYVNKNIYLVHGDATNLPFLDGSIDAYWSVQTLQHIKNLDIALSEAKRVLKPSGSFACYYRNYSSLWHLLSWLRNKEYHVEGDVPGSFYMSRGRQKHAIMLKNAFKTNILTRFSEILFVSGMRFKLGQKDNFWGKLDARLSGSLKFLGLFARQRSFHFKRP